MNLFFSDNSLQGWLLQLAGGLMLMLSGYRFLAASTNRLLTGWIDRHLRAGAVADNGRPAGKAGAIKAWLSGTLPAAILSVSRDSFTERLLSVSNSPADRTGSASLTGTGAQKSRAGRKNTAARLDAGSSLAMNLATWLWLVLAALLTLAPDSTLPAMATLALGLLFRLQYSKTSQNTGIVITSIGLMLLGMSLLIAAMAATPEAVRTLLLLQPGEFSGNLPLLPAAGLLAALLGMLRGGSITAGTLVVVAAKNGLMSPAAALLMLGCSWLGRSWAGSRRNLFMAHESRSARNLLIDTLLWAVLPLLVLWASADTGFARPEVGTAQAFLSLTVFLGLVLLEAATLFLADKTRPDNEQQTSLGSQSIPGIAKTRLGLLEYLSADDFSVCRRPERLSGNVSILRTLVSGTIGLTIDLLMELLNASQLPDEAKAIRRRVDSGRFNLEQQSRILDSALYACTPAVSGCGRIEEIQNYSASLVQLRRIGSDCAAIARSLSKQSKNRTACEQDSCPDLFAQISLILDLLRYVQDLSEGFNSTSTPQILEEMEATISGMRDTLKKQTIELIESRPEGSLKVELAFIETNDRLLHIADAGLELYRLLAPRSSG